MQRIKLSKTFFKKIARFFILPGLSICFFLIIVSLWNNFKISKIELTSYKKINLVGLTNFIGQNIFFIQEEDLKKTLMNKNPGIKVITIDKIYPNKIKIYYRPVSPLALFKVNRGYLIIDDDGQIIAKNKDKKDDLPVINYYQQFEYASFNPGDKLNYKDILAALDFIKISLNLGLNPDTIDIKDINMIASNIGDKKILFSAEKDLKKKQYELESIIKQFKIKGQDFKVLDLRFDKPVVKF